MTTAIPTRAELAAALDDPDPANPLARALAAALEAYTAAFETSVSRAGGFKGAIVVPAPKTEVEAFALEILSREFSAVGIRIKLKGDS